MEKLGLGYEVLKKKILLSFMQIPLVLGPPRTKNVEALVPLFNEGIMLFFQVQEKKRFL